MIAHWSGFTGIVPQTDDGKGHYFESHMPWHSVTDPALRVEIEFEINSACLATTALPLLEELRQDRSCFVSTLPSDIVEFVLKPLLGMISPLAREFEPLIMRLHANKKQAFK